MHEGVGHAALLVDSRNMERVVEQDSITGDMGGARTYAARSTGDIALEQAVAACRQSLADVPADGSLEVLYTPIRRFAALAAGLGIPPEQMTTELKGVLFGSLSYHAPARSAAARSLMMHYLVTAAINAYYGRPDD